jgi:hypothetical protein
VHAQKREGGEGELNWTVTNINTFQVMPWVRGQNLIFSLTLHQFHLDEGRRNGTLLHDLSVTDFLLLQRFIWGLVSPR